MTAGTQQVVTLYEDNGLSIEEIAAQLDLAEEAVKVALLQFSPSYRRTLGNSAGAANTFEDDDYKAASRVMARLVHSEDENVSLRAAKFVINEHKGRHDPKALKGININVHMFNETLKKARASIAQVKDKSAPIDVNAVVQQ